MPVPSLLRLAVLAAPALIALAPTASGQRGVSREEMWWAPTEEDWAKPCLITWQRSFDDAISVSLETGKPILVCVNMDGEIASEHYAGVRYRMPEIAELYTPYVCVIASVYRHTPRDYDEQGNRIPCPRFGTVTCGEHIAIEPILYEQYFDGERVAPRHIMLELDKQEVYDIYYAFDTESVFETVRAGIAERDPSIPVRELGDRPLRERVSSRDSTDRRLVEQAYASGDRDMKLALLQAAQQNPDAAPVDLLRLAVFGLDVELARMARQTLAEVSSPSAVDLIAEALRVPMSESEREGLVGALERIGAEDRRARTLAVVHRGLANSSRAIDVEDWARTLGETTSEPQYDDSAVLVSRVEYSSQAAVGRPDDPAAKVDLAESFLELALEPGADSKWAGVLLEDALRTAIEAEQAGAAGWRLNAVLAIAAYYLGDADEAHVRAERAMADMPAEPSDWNTFAVLTLFAQARQMAITQAMRDKVEWPGEWLADVHSTYAVIARHPWCTDIQVANHHDFLRSLDARGEAAQVLDEGMARFPNSWLLHERFRRQVMRERGIDGLEAAYERMLAMEDPPENIDWFAGYASLVSAEFRRRSGRGAEALAAYTRAMQHYERGVEKNPETRASADHYVALVLAGRARLAFEAGEYERSLAEILASFERREDAAATLDGLGISAVGTAKQLLAKLRENGDEELAARLQSALDALDPRLLELPEFERGGRPTGFDRPRNRDARGGGRDGGDAQGG